MNHVINNQPELILKSFNQQPIQTSSLQQFPSKNTNSMQKHFSHIYKRLISPSVIPKHQGSLINRYMKNRQNFKYCKHLWTGFNEEYLIHEGVDLRRKLKHAIQQEDKVMLLKVCSIPLYEKLQRQLRTLKLGSWGYHFEFLNLYKIKGGPEYLQENDTLNPLLKSPQWVRVQFKFKEELDNGKLVDRQMWIQRRIQEDNIPVEKKWYIYDLQC